MNHMLIMMELEKEFHLKDMDKDRHLKVMGKDPLRVMDKDHLKAMVKVPHQDHLEKVNKDHQDRVHHQKDITKMTESKITTTDHHQDLDHHLDFHPQMSVLPILDQILLDVVQMSQLKANEVK
jgi:hypothetical protein